MHGLRTRQWGVMKTWFFMDVLLCQAVPMACFVVLLAADPVTCDRNFCPRFFFMSGWISVPTLCGVAVGWECVYYLVLDSYRAFCRASEESGFRSACSLGCYNKYYVGILY